MTGWHIRRFLGWLGPLAVLALIGWWQMDRHLAFSPAEAQVAPGVMDPGAFPPGEGQMQEAQTGSRSGLMLSFTFYGSTPVLAWSPDGSRLAFNGAYDYFGWESAIEEHRDSLGLWVYERDSNTVRNLVKEQRYHPAWLGNELIASGCSPYEECTEGLFLTGLDGSNRLALAASVYHTLAANDHQVLFFNGFSGYTHWNRFDINTSVRETNLATSCSWEPPAELFVDQCVQEVGDLSVMTESNVGLWARRGTGPWVLIDSMPPHDYFQTGWDCERDHTGPVAPCLSPDGRQVAYTSYGDWGTLELRVHALPETAEELQSMNLADASQSPGEPSMAIGVEQEVGLFGAMGMGTEFQLGMQTGTGDAWGLGLLDVEGVFGMTGPPGPDGTWTGPAIAPTTWGPVERPLEPRTLTEQPSGRAVTVLAFDFYGDTPSLAWSPDSRHLAFNSAYRASVFLDEVEYGYGYPDETLGLWVVDVEGRNVTRVAGESRYHPAWLGNQRIVSGCSMWESCTAGLLLSDPEGLSSRQILEDNVYNPQAVNDHQVLFFSGIEADGTWHRYDVNTSLRETGLSRNCSWEPPAGMVLDQCIQQVGDVRVWIQVPTGLYAQVGNGAPMRIDPSPPWIFEDMGVWGCPRTSYTGPIEPCLSPDGRHVAYITRGGTGLSLHLVEVPSSP